jgi:hypothetical protein
MPAGENPYTSGSAVAILFGSLSLLGALAAPEVVFRTRVVLFGIGAVLVLLGAHLARYHW